MCHHDIGFCRQQQFRQQFWRRLKADDPDGLTEFAGIVESARRTKGMLAPECGKACQGIEDAARAHATFIVARDAAALRSKYPHVASAFPEAQFPEGVA